ncbi:hypothetical protein COV61_00360 [Candidatus Micrarchaeota archaeon CG11_big_fil_rev_8_21_14_0_20_47_5]|nr:MAG: hypothetical protein AUJ17_01715 [Candidatus Micrarchaeota archaeon CG1_02_47_40]PIN84358.1 MAG: hypothetical protein COV61_00360 [Candidatus Micrarchaeota archaeon CG11_big_fil_rev_8_21_14_0_20_47_5]
MEGFTTVAVSRETLAKLKDFREYGRESYDEILNKIMAMIKMAKTDSEGELNEETMNEIEKGRREIREGRGMSTKELMKKLGIE